MRHADKYGYALLIMAAGGALYWLAHWAGWGR